MCSQSLFPSPFLPFTPIQYPYLPSLLPVPSLPPTHDPPTFILLNADLPSIRLYIPSLLTLSPKYPRQTNPPTHPPTWSQNTATHLIENEMKNPRMKNPKKSGQYSHVGNWSQRSLTHPQGRRRQRGLLGTRMNLFVAVAEMALA